MELCYTNNQESLFRKYAKLVTWFGRLKDKDIALYLPNGAIRGNKGEYQMTVSPNMDNAKEIYSALILIDALQYELRSFKDAMDILYWHVGGGRKPSLLNQFYFDTLTVNPNANPETTSVDGYVQRGSVDEAFSTIRGGVGNGSSDSSGIGSAAPRLTASTTSSQYAVLTRGIYLLDTSPLSGAAIISAAVFSLYIDSNAAALGQSVGLTSSNPASNTALASGDYAIANFGSTQFATDIAHSAITLNQYTDWTLNASGLAAISKTSITKFASRQSGDIDNSAPVWASSNDAFFTPYFADAGSNKPKLTITYTLQGGFFAFL